MRSGARGVYLDDWLVEVDDSYLQSSVSYCGLSDFVPHYNRALSIVRNHRFDTLDMSSTRMEPIAESCRLLYGLLHQRFIVSEDGILKLLQKYRDGVYGVCPRAACNKKHLIPMGLSLNPNEDTVKLWCPGCHDIYHSDRGIDGAFFGPEVPIMFQKIANIPLKYKVFSTFLQETRDEENRIVPAIKQRLYRWGEKQPDTE